MSSAFKVRTHKTVYPAVKPTRPALSARGKVVLITSGDDEGDISHVLATSFALAQAKHIVMLGRDIAPLNEIKLKLAPFHPTTIVHLFAVDLADKEACTRVLEQVHVNLGPMDVLILNGAYVPTPEPILATDFAEFQKAFEVNARGNTILAQLFCRMCAEQDATLIDVMGAKSWLPAASVPVAAHSASKAAFSVVVKCLALERPDIRFFTVYLGIITDEIAEGCGTPPEADVVYDDPMVPGAFCVYLASPQADSLKGKSLQANWDVGDLELRTGNSSAVECAALLTMNMGDSVR